MCPPERPACACGNKGAGPALGRRVVSPPVRCCSELFFPGYRERQARTNRRPRYARLVDQEACSPRCSHARDFDIICPWQSVTNPPPFSIVGLTTDCRQKRGVQSGESCVKEGQRMDPKQPGAAVVQEDGQSGRHHQVRSKRSAGDASSFGAHKNLVDLSADSKPTTQTPTGTISVVNSQSRNCLPLSAFFHVLPIRLSVGLLEGVRAPTPAL